MPQLSVPIAAAHSATVSELIDSISAMVGHPDYPCLGAKSVFRRSRATIRVYDELAGEAIADRLLAGLAEFGGAVDLDTGFASFVAVFRGPEIVDEAHFEALLWAQLRALHASDDQAWSPGVSADPADPHFSFSAHGHAYFVIGMHPQASRDARRTAVPTLVFNPHELFQRLRRDGAFPRMRRRIRKRDEALQGTTNPMVADYGDRSEARQYAGRMVAPDWQAPFPRVPGRNGRADAQPGCPR